MTFSEIKEVREGNGVFVRQAIHPDGDSRRLLLKTAQKLTVRPLPFGFQISENRRAALAIAWCFIVFGACAAALLYSFWFNGGTKTTLDRFVILFFGTLLVLPVAAVFFGIVAGHRSVIFDSRDDQITYRRRYLGFNIRKEHFEAKRSRIYSTETQTEVTRLRLTVWSFFGSTASMTGPVGWVIGIVTVGLAGFLSKSSEIVTVPSAEIRINEAGERCLVWPTLDISATERVEELAGQINALCHVN
ncbi:MAG: hypothetical protein AAGJ38_03095 [Planctomycetota bacterium]